MTVRVHVKPELLRWACQRAGSSVEDLSVKFKHLPAWTQGTMQPTFKQASRVAYPPLEAKTRRCDDTKGAGALD